MWTYVIATGALLDPNGNLVGAGYSGAKVGKNSPTAQDMPRVGPIPVGIYGIENAVDTATHGPEVMWLAPDPANEMYGRSGFGIHGDSRTNAGCASEGCIILPRTVRDVISESSDRKLQVISYFNTGQQVVMDSD